MNDVIDYRGETATNELLSRLDIEWLTLNAIREMAMLGFGPQNASYENSHLIGADLWPEIFGAESSLIARNHISLGATFYFQKARELSRKQNTHVEPIDLVDAAILELKPLVVEVTEDNRQLNAEIQRLQRIKTELTKKRLHTETQALIHDATKVNRILPVSDQGEDYIEYVLPSGWLLRVRLLHPDHIEHVTGVDLLYESYSEDGREARLAGLQYKLFENKKVKIDSRLQKQLDKMKSCFCDDLPCARNNTAKRLFGLPYCAAFLRPTDKLQNPSSRLYTTGHHIPICGVDGIVKPGTRGKGFFVFIDDVLPWSVSLKVFEELFVTGKLGSITLNYDEIVEYHQRAMVLDPNLAIKLHAQRYHP